MSYPADRLAAYFAKPAQGLSRYCVKVDGSEVGVVAVRSPWLKGPYLEFLALLPPAQDRGIGSRIMAWLEGTAVEEEARNLWVCASSFNERALRFYARHGFEPVATLPGLVADGYEEILLRKFPLGERE
jgi:ribosomal protein S18 acetylase RimI-like enzyme